MFNLKLAEETKDDGGYAPGKDGTLRTSIPIAEDLLILSILINKKNSKAMHILEKC